MDVLSGRSVRRPASCPRVIRRAATIGERALRLRVVAGATGPVAGQGCHAPNDGKQKERAAPGNAGAPCQEGTHGGDHGRAGYTCGPHDRSRHGTCVLHGQFFRLHSKEWQMFEDPAHDGRVAFGVTGSTHRIEEKTNAQQAPHQPMRDAVREKIKENPGPQHGGNRESRSVRRLR